MSQVSRTSRWDDFVLLAVVPLGTTGRLQWSARNLARRFQKRGWDLEFQTLDLETGQASDGQCFLEPRPQSQVEQWLNATQPWLDDFNTAKDLPFTLADEVLKDNRFNNGTDMLMIRFGIDDDLQYYGKPISKTEFRHGKDPRDASVPHTLAVIATMTPAAPNKISTPEIAALVALASDIVVDPKFHQHTIIPTIRYHRACPGLFYFSDVAGKPQQILPATWVACRRADGEHNAVDVTFIVAQSAVFGFVGDF
ncbi:hypothetical protein ISF_01998 [Cordyceps fumosorosea ARSEF 2679]|uniref:Uncharacterized protein n=1 Tax=Cordyceps fumosorosea (strain ARSEF 2679) TaxID=1081104 RepID=A0A168CJA1_CORFA|nr:hypothetical protein ISF_01998 [Cordyceps fumosorosea ARSEF 2679]OAA71447.1 hypothetical protein ISF_01998 [Cordyceps fumosorosea ARSEF 2679]